VPEEPPPFEALYEPDVLARIDALLGEDGDSVGEDLAPGEPSGVEPLPDHGPVSPNGKIAEWARQSMLGGLMLGYANAIEQLFKADPETVEYAEDPGDAQRDDRPVRVVLVPDAPKQSKAFVRPWLFGQTERDQEQSPPV